MRRFLEETSISSAEGASHGEEEGGFPEYIAFGVLPLAMGLGILTRTTLAKWIP